MKKLIILILAVLVLGTIYVWLLPMVGIDTAINSNDPYKSVVLEREKNFGSRPVVPESPVVANADPDIENKSAPKTVQVATGQLVGVGTHKATGSVEVFGLGDQYGIKYADFSFESGPKLHVFLTNSLTINSTSVDLGPVSSTSGFAFYRVTPGVDVKKYKYIAVWSVDKKELYNYAEISNK